MRVGPLPSAMSPSLQTISFQAAVTFQNARLGERLERMRDTFARVVPTEFLTNLGRKNFTEVRLGESVQKEMTVLFSDMRDFTTIVESLGSSSSMDFVNDYLSRMEAPILENGGFVDSYAGDGIMALFGGAPEDAVSAAISMLRALSDLNGVRQSEGRPRLEIGIGISAGTLTLGTIGGVERFKYGVVGDTVNLAARIEGMTKVYGVPLIISGEAWSRLDAKARDTTRCLGCVRVAGRQEPVELFEVFAADPLERRRRKQGLAPEWGRAMDLYAARRFLTPPGCSPSCATSSNMIDRHRCSPSARWHQPRPTRPELDSRRGTHTEVEVSEGGREWHRSPPCADMERRLKSGSRSSRWATASQHTHTSRPKGR